MARKINLFKELEKKEKKAHLLDDINSILPEDIINLKLNSQDDFFCHFDCSPLEERSINQELEDYLIGKLDSLNITSRLNIQFSIPEASDVQAIKKAFSHHFSTKARNTLALNRKKARRWRINLILGLIFLAICLLAAHILSLPAFEEYTFAKVLSESLGIIGWVAIWEPAEYFLFAWREDASNLQKLMRLHSAKISINSN